MKIRSLKLLSLAGGISLVTAGITPQVMANEDSMEDLQDAKDTLQEARNMVQAMKSDAEIQQAMQSAKAVFLVPNYGRGALLVGGAGGEGVLLVRQDGQMNSSAYSHQQADAVARAQDRQKQERSEYANRTEKSDSAYADQQADKMAQTGDRYTDQKSEYARRADDKESMYAKNRGKDDLNGWSQPMFYDMGAISAGAEAGAEAGQIAMLLMTDEALETFTQENNFSLNADAGLTIIDYSERAQATAGKGDIVIWSDTEGAYAGLSVSIEGISWDEDENNAFYGRDVSPDAVMLGNVSHNHHNPLNSTMPGTR